MGEGYLPTALHVRIHSSSISTPPTFNFSHVLLATLKHFSSVVYHQLCLWNMVVGKVVKSQAFSNFCCEIDQIEEGKLTTPSRALRKSDKWTPVSLLLWRKQWCTLVCAGRAAEAGLKRYKSGMNRGTTKIQYICNLPCSCSYAQHTPF